MKKIIYFILSLFVIYIVGIFAFPTTFGNISEKIGLAGFQNSLISIKSDFEDFFMEFDFMSKFDETKNKTLEIKQNIEGQVEDTKNKIEQVQNSVDNVTNSINETTNSINKTVDSLNELQNSVVDIVKPSTSSGESLSGSAE